MPQQISFAQAEYEAKRKTMRRDRFLGEMERVMPWAALLAMLSPYDYLVANQINALRDFYGRQLLFLGLWIAQAPLQPLRPLVANRHCVSRRDRWGWLLLRDC
jgi:hypothetical protein